MNEKKSKEEFWMTLSIIYTGGQGITHRIIKFGTSILFCSVEPEAISFESNVVLEDINLVSFSLSEARGGFTLFIGWTSVRLWKSWNSCTCFQSLTQLFIIVMPEVTTVLSPSTDIRLNLQKKKEKQIKKWTKRRKDMK